ncbi:hypothetical protein UFOVP1361_20 [uncultured Caudovirales phage]|uniref:Uncharacterized protein n=1 Tax=uncultured Caudovirales phage TaxID=2100421 RepID=A0A6J5RUR5_9CAUD|nr:hypothetical protein UFOVP1361_20 [uncultured Caudovirales phage]
MISQIAYYFIVLERGYRLLACGESAQSGRSMKQEPTEVTTQITA